MKYFLIFSISLLSILIITADDPFKKKIPYELYLTDTNDTMHFKVPSDIGDISYFSNLNANHKSMINCVIDNGLIEQADIKKMTYEAQQIDANITVYMVAKNDDFFKIMLTYSSLNDNQNKKNVHTCDSFNDSYTTRKWLGTVKLNEVTSIPLDNTTLFIKILSSK